MSSNVGINAFGELDLKNIEDYRFEHLVCSCYGKGSDKRIKLIVTKHCNEFKVEDHGKVIATYSSLSGAAERYNEIN